MDVTRLTALQLLEQHAKNRPMSTVRFIHTADWQVGKPFASIADEEKRQRLRQVRLEAIAQLGEIATRTESSFIVVSGDLFDSPTVTETTLSAALAQIGKLGVSVYAIPGNHDHGGPGSVWSRTYFQREREALAPNFQLLTEEAPFEIDQAVLLPCPLMRRHEPTDTTAWLRELDWNSISDKPRIVLAHGGAHGFSTETDDEEIGRTANRIALGLLPADEIDYIALGDWHGTKEVNAKAWYSGALEQDRFPKGKDYQAGNALVVTCTRGANPAVSIERSGLVGWHRKAITLTDDAALSSFDQEMAALVSTRVSQDVLELHVEGNLGFAAITELRQRLTSLQGRLIRLKLIDDVRLAPTDEELEALVNRPADPLIGRVASRLREYLEGTSDEAPAARLALRELYRLVNS